jgi:uncharacterized membrane protein
MNANHSSSATRGRAGRVVAFVDKVYSLKTAVETRRGRTCASMVILLAGWLLSLTVTGSAFAGACTVTLPGYTCTSFDAPVPGATGTQASGINDAGQIVGSYFDAGIPHSFLYVAGSFTPIDIPGITRTFAKGINDAGHIVGDYGAGGVNRNHGFLYVGGSFTPIDVPGSSYTFANGINDAGHIVGTSDATTGGAVSSGFLYVGGSFTPITVPGNAYTQALGINNANHIVGLYAFNATAAAHGFLDVGGSFTPIDVPGGTNTFPQGINDADNIVGFTGNHGFLYVGGNFTPIDVSGATRTQPHGINNAGQIVGIYSDATGTHGFLATPSITPAPSCFSGVQNNVGDIITVVATLSSTGINQNGLGQSLLVESEDGELTSPVITDLFVPHTIKFVATQANVGISGRITNGTGTAFCSITVSANDPPLLTDALKGKFARFATRITKVAEWFSTLSKTCKIGGVPGLVCKIPSRYLAANFKIHAALGGRIAEDPIDNNFTQLATPVIPSILPWMGAPDITTAVVNAFNALMANGAQIVGIEQALYTTLNRASGAFAASNTVWFDRQLQAATRFEGQLSVFLSQEASLLTTFQNALQANGITATITPSEVLNYEMEIVSTGQLPADEVSALQEFGADASLISYITQLARVQDINAVAGTFPQLLTEPDLISLLNSFPVGPPTKKIDCKDGLWKAYNTPKRFKNEGDCIQFIFPGK